MKNIFFLSICLSVLNTDVLSQSINYSEHIAPIIYEKCTSCHREGEIAPMPLTSYDEVRNWSEMIRYVTEIRYMPPWKPNPEYSKFLGENYLEDEEIQLIADWVAAGTPQGDPMKEPPLPYFPDGSQLGEPDLILTFEEAFEHRGNNQDDYRIIVLPTELMEDKQVAALELRPGNKRIVHHAIFSYDDTGRARQLDAADPGYGYDGFGGFGISNNPLETEMLPGYVPGQQPRFFPKGIGQKLPAGADLLVQMHYAPVPTAQSDSSTVNIFFKEETVEREVRTEFLVPIPGMIVNGPFIIQANQKKTFHCQTTVPQKVSLVSITPHMHLLGKKWEVYALTPNRDTIPLIKIDDWDFNWQGTFHFDRFIVLEVGSTIHAFATYDNTSDNPNNPNFPPRWMSWGEKTTDEMFFLPIAYVPYRKGDEDVIFQEDQTTSTDNTITLKYPKTKLYPIFPNPTADQITLGFSLAKGSAVNLDIYDVQGKLVKSINQKVVYPIGKHQMQIAVTDLPKGVYFLSLIGEDFKLSEKFKVQ
ncbi:MAG: T9SS type A sorting domain-containing protein [Bacteroidota bacterium]